MYTVIKKNSNDVILTEGTLEPFIYIVKSGTLRAVKTSGKRFSVLGELGPGDFLGEMAHLGSTKVHSASVICVTDAELIQIEADKIYEVLGANPVWLKALLKDMVRKIENSNFKLESFKKNI